ncbi:MAG: hypothetical protein ACMXYC_03575 [Candidatus Woesearchaeota archaeon]
MEQIQWMQGMTMNMKNICSMHMDKPMMQELMHMSESLHMNCCQMQAHQDVMMMEPMMRALECAIMEMDVHNDKHKMAMKHMMQYMMLMQQRMMQS